MRDDPQTHHDTVGSTRQLWPDRHPPVVGIGRIAVADVARGGAMGMSNDETFIVLAVTVLS